MKKFINYFIISISLILFASCNRKAERRLVVYRGDAQGTTFQIKFYSNADSTQIKNGIDSIFCLIDYTASLYDSNSIISKVNNNLDIELNEHFIKIFNLSQFVSKETDGYFDVTVAPLVKAWGFWSKKDNDITQPHIDSLKSLVGCKKVSILKNRLQKELPDMLIDFNAIAQGYTNDVIAEYLMSRGYDDFLIEIGGEVRANGLKGNKEKWIVGIERPADNNLSEQVLLEKIKLNNKSIATSGNYRKYIIKDGKKLSHIINPITGYPANHSLLSVTVLADNCALADAFATAFMAMGIEKSKEILAKNPQLDAYFIYADSSGNIKIEFSKGFDAIIVK